MKTKTFLEYYILNKTANATINSVKTGSFKNWWITKIIVFFGTILGYIIFISICIDVIFHDHAWYWKLLCGIILLMTVLTIINGIKKTYNSWKTNLTK